MYIASGQGQTIPWGENFDVNRKVLPFVASLKPISLKSDFIHTFNYLIHVYSLRVGADNPLGTKFLCPSTERPYLFAYLLQVSK